MRTSRSRIALETYRNNGYKIFDKRALGVLSGLSAENCLCEDIRKVITPQGFEVFVSDKEKKVFLPKKNQGNLLTGSAKTCRF